MTEKFEPLKGKEKVVLIRYLPYGVFYVNDVKSAVQWLLRKIEEDIQYWEKDYEEYERKYIETSSLDAKKECAIADQVILVLKNRVKSLIKEAFADVMEDGE